MPKFSRSQSQMRNLEELRSVDDNLVIEVGAKIINPQNVVIGSNVYIGHNAVLNGYLENTLEIGNNVWIGANSYLHAAGGIKIESDVGIGPGVKMISSSHDLKRDNLGPIIDLPLHFAPILIKKGSDIGTGAIVMPGVTIEEGTQVGAGAVVTKSTSRYSIVAGVPARTIGVRKSVYEKKLQSSTNSVKILKNTPAYFSRFLSDVIFIVFSPIVVIYSWARYFIKKIFHLKPDVIISPLGAPLPFFAVKALLAQGYRANNFAFSVPDFFRDISLGFVLYDHRFLKIFSYLTDSIFIFLWALLRYDIFEFPFSGGILANSHLRKLELLILRLSGKKISIYGYGSDCKILSDIRAQGFKYNNAMDRTEKTESQKETTIRANVSRAKKYANVLVAGGDLIHFGEKGIMLPLAEDLSLWHNSPPSKKKIITLVHSTNHRSHKGSRFIIEIVEKLKNKLPVQLLLVEKKTIAECRKIYSQGDIFIPDVISGWHGFTAIEAMATGRPVITYLRPDIAKFHSYYAQDIPVISANPDNLAWAITKLAKDRKLRESLGKKSRDYALKYHSLEFVGALRGIIYEYIWDGKKINQKIFEKEAKKRKLV